MKNEVRRNSNHNKALFVYILKWILWEPLLTFLEAPSDEVLSVFFKQN